jgi:hypothetical protein
MWLRNCWYVIAWEHEIAPADSPQLLRRVVLNEPLLLYRTSAGEVVALEDRCVHRHAPLSKGRGEGAPRDEPEPLVQGTGERARLSAGAARAGAAAARGAGPRR